MKKIVAFLLCFGIFCSISCASQKYSYKGHKATSWFHKKKKWNPVKALRPKPKAPRTKFVRPPL